MLRDADVPRRMAAALCCFNNGKWLCSQLNVSRDVVRSLSLIGRYLPVCLRRCILVIDGYRVVLKTKEGLAKH